MTIIRTLVAAIVAVLSVGAATATAAGPTLTVGTGCAAQCITKALVTTTTTTAKVELQTTVPARLEIFVRKQSASNGSSGGFALDKTMKATIPSFSAWKKATFEGLEPGTTYDITVKATDLKGQTASQQGTFQTRSVKTSGVAGPDTIASGAGCAAQCITKALVRQQTSATPVVEVEIATSTQAKLQVVVSRDKPSQTTIGLVQWDEVSRQETAGLVKSWKTRVDGLGYGRKYYAVVRARDGAGSVSIRQGSFRTPHATAVVTINKIKVVNDGDKGRNKGELFFDLFLGDDAYPSWNTGLVKLGSGAVFDIKSPGSSRPGGFSFDVSGDGDATFAVSVLGEECDAVRKKNCVREGGGGAYGPSLDQWAVAGGTFHVSELVRSHALPQWYGTGVTPPRGHDAYFVFGATDRYVKFLVLATIDLRVD